jgi:hypothetical protein
VFMALKSGRRCDLVEQAVLSPDPLDPQPSYEELNHEISSPP